MDLFFDSIILLLLLGSAMLGRALLRDRKQSGTWEAKHKKITLAGAILLFLMFVTIFWGSFIEPRLIMTRRISLDLPNFAPDKPVRVALVSDVHVGTYKKSGWLKRVSKRIVNLQPDLVLLAGDLIVDEPKHAKYLSSFQILASRFPTYAVLGDHDYNVQKEPKPWTISEDTAAAVQQALSNAGVKVMQNTAEEIELNNSRFWLVGLDDWLARKTDMEYALTGCHSEPQHQSKARYGVALREESLTLDQGKEIATVATLPRDDDNCSPIVVLVHNPDFILDPESKKADLILSGNTHGGQIRLPWLGAVSRLPSKLPRIYDKGLFVLPDDPRTQLPTKIKNTTTGGRKLFITSGISESGPRARLFNPPEIVLLEIY